MYPFLDLAFAFSCPVSWGMATPQENFQVPTVSSRSQSLCIPSSPWRSKPPASPPIVGVSPNTCDRDLLCSNDFAGRKCSLQLTNPHAIAFEKRLDDFEWFDVVAPPMPAHPMPCNPQIPNTSLHILPQLLKPAKACLSTAAPHSLYQARLVSHEAANQPAARQQ